MLEIVRVVVVDDSAFMRKMISDMVESRSNYKVVAKFGNGKELIENIDKYIVGPLVEKLEQSGEEYRILVLPDHPTPIRIRTHSSDAIPYLLYDSTKQLGCYAGYNERVGTQSGIIRENGYQLMNYLLSN